MEERVRVGEFGGIFCNLGLLQQGSELAKAKVPHEMKVYFECVPDEVKHANAKKVGTQISKFICDPQALALQAQLD